jgi:plasmid stability protein
MSITVEEAATMATRTVRLDDETEQALAEIRAATGLRMSEALKRGIHALRSEIVREGGCRPYDVFRELDLGPGGYASVPSTEVKRGVKEAVRKKLAR